MGWEHINLTGDYHWDTSPTLGPDEFRPLRTHVSVVLSAGIAGDLQDVSFRTQSLRRDGAVVENYGKEVVRRLRTFQK
jgi:hypothetical protein